MDKSKLSLSRNRNKDYFKKFFSSSKKSIFKTTQEESKTIQKVINTYNRGLKPNNTNFIFSVKNHDKFINLKYKNDYLPKLKTIDDSDLKVTSPLSNTIRYNYSIKRFRNNNFYFRKFKNSTSYSGYELEKLNKPHLLKLLNKDLKLESLKDANNKPLSLTNREKLINDYILEKNKMFNGHSRDMKSKKYLLKKSDDISKKKKVLKLQNNDEKKEVINSARNLIKSFKKFSKLKINFPLEFPHSVYIDKLELRDKVSFDYYKDENMRKIIRKSLYYDINSFDIDNGLYSEFHKSIPNYINYICDINILPHIKNKLLYSRIITGNQSLNEIDVDRNIISREVSKTINRRIINNIKKEALEKEEKKKKKKRIRNISSINKMIVQLCLEKNNEDLLELTSEQVVEINDYFGKNIDYKFVNIAKDKIKNAIYKDERFYKIEDWYKSL